MTLPEQVTDTNQASEDELDREIMERFGMEAHEGWYDSFRYDDRVKLRGFIRTEKLKLLAEVRKRVIGEDEKLVIPDYPKTDEEGELLYSKRAAKEGRKQVTARYHTRKKLRNEQRTELTKLEAEL